jgi:hypothetical protein
VKKDPIKIIKAHLGNYKADGLAWPEDRTIAIDKRLKGLRKLDVLIHEISHIQNPKWPEIMVEGKASEMAKILWECGLRFVDLGDGE